jgi:uncharacterized protein YfaS (alpha-2-macroglobulin family)
MTPDDQVQQYIERAKLIAKETMSGVFTNGDQFQITMEIAKMIQLEEHFTNNQEEGE